MLPPIMVLVVGISLIPNIGNHTQKMPPKTSVKDNKVRSAAGKCFDPIEYKIIPEQTKVPCKADNDEFLNVVKNPVSLNIKTIKEKVAQNSPATATVVKVGVFFLHLKETEKIEKPNDDRRPIPKPNKVPICRLVKAIKMIPIAAIIIAVKVVVETFSLRKMYPSIAVINGIAASIKSVIAAVV